MLLFLAWQGAVVWLLTRLMTHQAPRPPQAGRAAAGAAPGGAEGLEG